MRPKSQRFFATLGSALRDLPSARLQLLLVVAAVVLLILVQSGFRIQATESGPRGIWRFQDAEVARGAWVALCPGPAIAEFARRRAYVHTGPCAGGIAPLLKRVVALPGDTLEISALGIVIDGALLPRTAVLSHDRDGRPLPHPNFGRYTVAADTLWVANARPDSFDSRYFGPVERARVLSVADAVLVAGGSDDG